jgi:aspartyl-tRNA(Asn)/glutamyl-tRNA(Gln) amidotransferase subunit B
MTQTGMKTHLLVGFEVHVQLATASKLFCACPVRFGEVPNSCVCPVCLGHPGTLPVLNAQAVEYAIRAGLALNCTIAPVTKWDRKSYYYPDLPKNYQISQYDQPIAREGSFEIDVEGRTRAIRIRRAHLEEDAGKNIHDAGDRTLVDLNRAGTPLLEIVTEPDIHSPEEAYTFCIELQRLMTHLGISEAIMQKGQMRFEPNINVVIEAGGREHRTPISEVKNLNSFRAARNAVAYELQRQAAAWSADPGYVHGQRPNENRGWDDDRGATEYQREKEAAHDYRYFPDPDLVPVHITAGDIERVRTTLPEHPVARRRRWVRDLAVSEDDAATLVADRSTADLFDAVIGAGARADLAAKQFVNTWLRLANDRATTVGGLGIDVSRMTGLVGLVADGVVSATSAAVLAEHMLTRGDPPAALAESLGLVQVRDEDATAGWVEEVFAANEQAVRDALSNPRKTQAAVGFLRGQVMRASGGRADARLAGRLIEDRLSHIRKNAG